MLKNLLSVFFGVSLLFIAGAVAQSALNTSAATLTTAPQMLASSRMQQGSEASATAPSISIDNFSFSPATLTVAVGTTVTWVNKDDVPHTVVSNDRVFASHALDTDDKFSYTFNKAGKYEYFCSVHPKMTATVIVK